MDCCWRNISARESSTKTRNTSSLQGDCHLVCSRATSSFTPPPPVTDIFGLLAICFIYINTKIKKRFSFCISSALILFRAFSLHLNSFVQFELFNNHESREEESENNKLKPLTGHFQFLILKM